MFLITTPHNKIACVSFIIYCKRSRVHSYCFLVNTKTLVENDCGCSWPQSPAFCLFPVYLFLWLKITLIAFSSDYILRVVWVIFAISLVSFSSNVSLWNVLLEFLLKSKSITEMTDLRTVERSFICRCACHVPRNKTKLNHLLSTNVLKNVSTGNVKTVWQKKLHTTTQ